MTRLLRRMGFLLRINRKAITPKTHPLRDEQLRHVAALRSELAPGTPAISVDAKKEELIGRFINRETAWKQDSEAVFDHEFSSRATGRATRSGIYDLQANTGSVGLGLSRDTPYFAVNCMEAW